MFKKLLALLLILAVVAAPAHAANKWRNQSTQETIVGSISPSSLDDNCFDYLTAPLDRLLSNYRSGCDGYWTSSSTFSVSAGEVTCSNAGGTIRCMRQNTSATAVTWSNIDTGAEAGSTAYAYYAVADADATTFTVTISANLTTPSGVTYYKKLGEFYNNSSGNIEMGGIISMWSGTVASIPAGWVLCDGNNGTPNLQDYFILGAGNLADPGDSKASSHFSLAGTGSAITYAASASGGGLGSGDQRLVYSTYDHMPPYYALCYVMKQGVE